MLWTFFILIIFVGLGPTYCEGGATLSEDPLYEDFKKMLSGDMSITRERWCTYTRTHFSNYSRSYLTSTDDFRLDCISPHHDLQ